MKFWWQDPIKRNYVSELDLFLQSMYKRHEFHSISQQKEEKEYQWIAKLRDDPKVVSREKII